MIMAIRIFAKNALPLLCRAVAAFAIHHGLKLNDIIDGVKKALIEAAEKELQRTHTQSSISRVSVMTGIHRPDVAKISKQDRETREDFLSKIIWRWQTEEAYCTKTGVPRVLSAEGAESEFANLVRSVSTALNPYTILFELERSNHIQRTARGLKLTQSIFQPDGDSEKALEYLSLDLQDLLLAVNENIFEAQQGYRNHHITTEYDAVPLKHTPIIRNFFLDEGRKLHKRLRGFLQELDEGERLSDTEYTRVVFGSFGRIDTFLPENKRNT
jgi:hypothetical protein